MNAIRSTFNWLNSLSLVAKISIGIIAGLLLALVSPPAGQSVAVLGNLFVAALKAVAPALIFLLVVASIANQGSELKLSISNRIIA